MVLVCNTIMAKSLIEPLNTIAEPIVDLSYVGKRPPCHCTCYMNDAQYLMFLGVQVKCRYR